MLYPVLSQAYANAWRKKALKMAECDEDSYEAIVEEMEVLKAVFCNPDEFAAISWPSTESRGPASFKINLACNTAEEEAVASSSVRFTVEMNVILPLQYPDVLPNVSLSCTNISKANLQTLRYELYEYAAGLPAQPKIMELAMWLQQRASCYYRAPTCPKKNNQKGDDSPCSLVLLRLDHMRNRTRYVKLLCSWAKELNVKGSLFFARHLILVLLAGTQPAVKEYVRRHKSCNVDVDSHGKPCKERMITVLTHREQDACSR